MIGASDFGKIECKNNKIQILRGLAIIAVVIIHSYPSGIFGVFLRPFVNYAVAMFIFLSGYLTRIEITDYKKFIYKRIKKVAIPYCIWSVIYMIPQGFEGFWLKFLTGRCCGIYYYIFVYIQFVLLTPLIVKLIKSKHRWIGWLITPVFTFGIRYILNLRGYTFVSSQFNYLFVAWFIYYYAGMLLGNNIITVKKNNILNISAYFIAILLSVCEGLLWYKYGDMDMATTQLRLTSIGTSLATILFSYHYIHRKKLKQDNFIAKTLILLGDASFGIYLSHILVKNILQFIPIFNSLLFPINSIIILSVSTICVLIGKKILRNASWVLGL